MPGRGTDQVIFPLIFVFCLCNQKLYQLLVMCLKQIYSIKLGRNLAMNLIAATSQAILKRFSVIAR